MRVAMQVPEKLPAEKRLGLILLFHGYQGNENNYIGLTVDALKRLQLLDQYVVISGKSKGPGWTTEDDAPVLHLIRWAKETYSIDSRRLFIFGSSNGAAYVGRFGSAHPELVAGVVGYCGNYKFSPTLKDRKGETQTEWYFVHGGKDNPQNSRRACNELKALGYRPIFRQMDGYGHTDIWDSRGHPDSTKADAVRDDWIRWLHALRNKGIPPTAEEKKTLAAGLEKFKAATPPDERDAVLKEVARIGGEPGGAILVEALGSADRLVRAAAARTAEQTSYGKPVIARLIALLDDDAEEVRSAAIQGLARAAGWRCADAQSTLSRLARAAKAPLADRLRAIAALGSASKLPLLGNCEDGLPIWTLVLLLDDDNPRVREAAFAALEKDVPDTFAYQPNQPPAERKASLEKWKKWCQDKCGPAPELPR
jgi:pimeloyl-ACP methyl ester carboxylesterase